MGYSRAIVGNSGNPHQSNLCSHLWGNTANLLFIIYIPLGSIEGHSLRNFHITTQGAHRHVILNPKPETAVVFSSPQGSECGAWGRGLPRLVFGVSGLGFRVGLREYGSEFRHSRISIQV